MRFLLGKMKIIGFVHNELTSERINELRSEWSLVLKGDSCLLNGRKPFFLPDWSEEVGYTPCIILRVSRLGKEIELRFADRYYDAVAYGADFAALDILREAQATGRAWTQALVFDYSLAIGEYEPTPVPSLKGREYNGKELTLSPEEAIMEASKVMTIRQGDLIYIQAKQAPQVVHKEDIIRVEIDGEEKLYCKVK